MFAVGHNAPVDLGRETAALLALRPEAALSHDSAATLWGIRPPSDGPLDVIVCGSEAARLEGVRVHRTRILERKDVRVRQGLPVTSPARTLLDLAELLSERRLEMAFDQAVVSRLMRTSDLAELLQRARGRRGRAALRTLLERQHGPALTRSEAEERFLALIRQAQLPEPAVNVRLRGYEVDFYWPGQRLVVEIDGFRFHSTQRAFEHERGKDVTLQAAGITVLRFTWRQLQDESYAVIAWVARALASVC